MCTTMWSNKCSSIFFSYFWQYFGNDISFVCFVNEICWFFTLMLTNLWLSSNSLLAWNNLIVLFWRPLIGPVDIFVVKISRGWILFFSEVVKVYVREKVGLAHDLPNSEVCGGLMYVALALKLQHERCFHDQRAAHPGYKEGILTPVV